MSEPPEQVPEAPIEPRATLSFDDPVAARLRGFGPLGVVSILSIMVGNLLVVPLSAILVLLWARRSHTPWREIGYVRPVSWVSDLAIGICFGVAGVQQAMVVGVVFGTIFAVTGRIWTLMFAHAAFDVVAVAIIYWNLEDAVAHVVFK